MERLNMVSAKGGSDIVVGKGERFMEVDGKKGESRLVAGDGGKNEEASEGAADDDKLKYDTEEEIVIHNVEGNHVGKAYYVTEETQKETGNSGSDEDFSKVHNNHHDNKETPGIPFAQNVSYANNYDYGGGDISKGSFSHNMESEAEPEEKYNEHRTPSADPPSCDNDAYMVLFPDKCGVVEIVNGQYRTTSHSSPHDFGESGAVAVGKSGGNINEVASVQAASDNRNHSNRTLHSWSSLCVFVIAVLSVIPVSLASL